MNCKSCGVVIEWAGINTTYIDAEQSPFCGNTSKKHEPASPVAQPENGEIMPYANWKEGDSVPAPVGKYAPPTPVHMPPRGVTTGTHKTKGDNCSMPVPNGDGMESAGQEAVREPLQPVVTRSGVAQPCAGGEPCVSRRTISAALLHRIAGILASPSEQAAAPTPLREVSSGIYTSDSKPRRVDDARVREIINRALSLTGGAEPPKDEVCDQYGFGTTPELPVAAEPPAWPSDLPANGTGAMKLITNFWTGDLKGLTKEGARIVDSLVAHVSKGTRAELANALSDGFKLNEAILKLRAEAAGLREQLELAQERHTHDREIKRGLFSDKEAAEAQPAPAREALREEISIKTDGPCQLGVLNFCRCKDCIRKRSLAALAPAKDGSTKHQ